MNIYLGNVYGEHKNCNKIEKNRNKIISTCSLNMCPIDSSSCSANFCLVNENNCSAHACIVKKI